MTVSLEEGSLDTETHRQGHGGTETDVRGVLTSQGTDPLREAREGAQPWALDGWSPGLREDRSAWFWPPVHGGSAMAVPGTQTQQMVVSSASCGPLRADQLSSMQECPRPLWATGRATCCPKSPLLDFVSEVLKQAPAPPSGTRTQTHAEALAGGVALAFMAPPTPRR